MPIINQNLKNCGDITIESGRKPLQMGWYQFISNFCKDKTVLDVGCGLGKGLNILKKKARKVHGQEIDSKLKINGVFIKDIAEFSANSYDVVVAIDVIEHVVEDIEFLGHLLRVSRKIVFISTPNWYVTPHTNLYHIREYSPFEFARLIKKSLGNENYKAHFFKGSAKGDFVCKIKNIYLYELKNYFYSFSFVKKMIRKLGLNLNICEHMSAFIYKKSPHWTF